MTIRWLSHEEVESIVNPALALQGWPELNIDVARVLGAFDNDECVEILTIQLFPVLGPMLRLDNTKRDSGTTTRALAEAMEAYLKEHNTRGCLAIAESPVTERLCKNLGMGLMEHPVFLSVSPGSRPS